MGDWPGFGVLIVKKNRHHKTQSVTVGAHWNVEVELLSLEYQSDAIPSFFVNTTSYDGKAFRKSINSNKSARFVIEDGLTFDIDSYVTEYDIPIESMNPTKSMLIQPTNDETHLAQTRNSMPGLSASYDHKTQIETIEYEQSLPGLSARFKITARFLSCGLSVLPTAPLSFRIRHSALTNFRDGAKGDRYFGVAALKDIGSDVKAGDMFLMPSRPFKGQGMHKPEVSGKPFDPILQTFTDTGHSQLVRMAHLENNKDSLVGFSVFFTNRDEMRKPNSLKEKLKFRSWTLNDRPPECRTTLSSDKIRKGIRDELKLIWRIMKTQ